MMDVIYAESVLNIGLSGQKGFASSYRMDKKRHQLKVACRVWWAEPTCLHIWLLDSSVTSRGCVLPQELPEETQLLATRGYDSNLLGMSLIVQNITACILLKKLEVKLPRGWRLYKRRCMSGKLKDRRRTRNRIRTMRSCIPCPQSTLRQAAFSILKNESGPKPRQLEGSAWRTIGRLF